MFFHAFILSILLTSIGLSSTWAAELSEQEKARALAQSQMVEHNLLLQQTKQKSIKLFNQTKATALLDVVYKQVVSVEWEGDEDEALVVLIPQASYKYITSKSLDGQGFPVVEGQAAQYKVILKKNQTFLAWLIRSFEVKAGEEMGVFMHEDATIAGLRLRTSDVYVNFKATPDAIGFSIDNNPRRSFPAALGVTDFVKLSTIRKPAELPAHTKAFKDKLCVAEGFSSDDFAKKLQALYNANVKFLTGTPLDAAVRIPLITHTIWASSDAFPEQYAKWLTTTTKSCPTSDGWKHIVWTMDEHVFDGLSDDVKKELSFEDIVSFDSPLQGAVRQLLDDGHPALVSKIFRHIALQKFGGVFRGTDTEIIHSLTSYQQAFDFYVGLDGFNGVTTAGGLIAAIPNHPITTEVLSVIQRNLDPSICPAYLTAAQADKITYTLLGFGYGPISIALMAKAGLGENRDMIAPPRVFSPQRKAADILEWDDRRMQWPVDTMAIHYLTRFWAK